MNERDLFRAIGNVDDDLVAAANRSSTHRPLRVYLSGALAACLCVVLLFVALRFLPTSRTGSPNNELATGQVSLTGNSSPVEGIGESFQQTGLPGNQAGEPGSAELQGSGQQPTMATSPSAQIPEDFRFTISWPDHSFDSETGILTEYDGLRYHLTLTDEDLSRVWSISSALGAESIDPDGTLVLSYTANGESVECRFTRTPPSHASLLFDQLISTIEHAASQVR